MLRDMIQIGDKIKIAWIFRKVSYVRGSFTPDGIKWEPKMSDVMEVMSVDTPIITACYDDEDLGHRIIVFSLNQVKYIEVKPRDDD